jgi:hypothetical protein
MVEACARMVTVSGVNTMSNEKKVIKTNVNQILEDLKKNELDQPLATILIAEKSDKLFFLGEAILISVGLFLLHKYLGGLIGDTLEKFGKNHKKKLIAYWEKIKAGKANDMDLKEYNHELQRILEELQHKEISKNEIKNAENGLIILLIDHGSVKKQAIKVAETLTNSIFHEKY